MIDQMRPIRPVKKKSDKYPYWQTEVDSNRHKLRRGHPECTLKVMAVLGLVPFFFFLTSSMACLPRDMFSSPRNFSHCAAVYGNVDKFDVRLSRKSMSDMKIRAVRF